MSIAVKHGKPGYNIYVSEHGSILPTEIAGLLAAAISDLGYEATFPAPGLPEWSPSRVNLVVAPHEFFPLQKRVDEDRLLRSARSAVMVGVEPPGTPWFELAARYASVAAAVLDISPGAVAELAQRGIRASHVQLGYHSIWDAWGGDPSGPRSRDVVLLDSASPRRNAVLSAAAPLLWDCEAELRLFEPQRAVAEPSVHFAASPESCTFLAGSRTLLSIHGDAAPRFGWVRALQAVVNGCLVVTEPSEDYGPLSPGLHLVAAPADYLGAYTASLVVDDPLRAEMTMAAYELVRSKLPMTTTMEPICEQLDRDIAREQPDRKVIPLPPAPPPPQAASPLSEGVAAGEHEFLARVRELIVSETALVRVVEGLQSQLQWGSRDHAELEVTPGWSTCKPDLSVVVTTHDCEASISQAIDSVFDPAGVSVELVIVDDHSRDRSRQLVEETIRSRPHLAIAFVKRAANAGPSVARNCGIGLVRSEYVLNLDGDKFLYPNGMRRMLSALESSPESTFSYGILAKTDASGLLSYLPWDVDRLCRSDYIDGVALIRRSTFSDLGGYDSNFGVRGSADYEFWLRVASAGGRGQFVPAVVGAQMVRPGSRHAIADHDATLVRDLRGRFPFLPWPDDRR